MSARSDSNSQSSPDPSACNWCRVVKAHLVACPSHNPLLLLPLWQEGHDMALKGMKNPCAGVETFTLGYTVGELELAEELLREDRAVKTAPEAEPERQGTVFHQPPSAVQLTHAIGKVKLQELMNQDF